MSVFGLFEFYAWRFGCSCFCRLVAMAAPGPTGCDRILARVGAGCRATRRRLVPPAIFALETSRSLIHCRARSSAVARARRRRRAKNRIVLAIDLSGWMLARFSATSRIESRRQVKQLSRPRPPDGITRVCRWLSPRYSLPIIPRRHAGRLESQAGHSDGTAIGNAIATAANRLCTGQVARADPPYRRRQ